MNTRRYFQWSAAILLGALANTAFASPTITLATTQWEPYVQQNKAYHGYAYDIVVNAFRQAGYKVNVKFMPWSKAIKEVKSGQVQGVFPEYYSSESDKRIAFSQPFSGGPVGLFKLKKSNAKINNQDLTSLQKLRFGVVKGYVNVPAIDNNSTLTKVVADSDKANLTNLYLGKVDVIFADKFTADYILQHELPPGYSKSIEFMHPKLGYKRLYVGVSKSLSNYKLVVKAFNRGLATIQHNGLMTKILDKDAKFSGDLMA